MRLLWRFVSRDLKDMAVGWFFLGIVTVLVFLGRNTFYNASWGEVAFYPYMIFSMIYFMHVWNASQIGLGREFLLSLPVSRRKLFFFQWARTFVGVLPSIIFCFSFLGKIQSHLKIESPIDAGIAVALLFFAVPGFALMFIGSERMRRLPVKGARALMFVRQMFWMVLFGAFIFAWLFSFSTNVPSGFAVTIHTTYILYCLICWRWSYLRWLWGFNAPVLRQLVPGLSRV